MTTAAKELNVLCFCENDDEILLEMDKVDKVVCSAGGRVLEFFNNKVVGGCKIPLLNPSALSIFYSYDPFIKYYLIIQDDALVVLQKVNGDVEYFKTYENVQNYEIGDFLIIGRPQVKIFWLDEMEPCITDFSSSNLCGLNEQKGMQRFPDLNRKLHMMHAALIQLNSISEHKKQIQEHYFNQLCSVGNSLTISKKPWQRIVNGCWVICFCVQNNYNCSVDNLQLIVNNDIMRTIETKVCDFTRAPKCLFSRKNLPPNSSAYVIGIVNEPNFSNLGDTNSLECSLLYNVSKTDTCIMKALRIPPFILSVEDVIGGNLCVFKSDQFLLHDIITCTAIHETTLLEIRLKRSVNDAQVIDTIVNKLNVTKLKINEDKNVYCYIVNSCVNSTLSGLILFIENRSEFVYSFVCYSKDVSQIALFKRSLVWALETHLESICLKRTGTSREEDGSIIAAVNTLDEEFEYFTSVMRKAIPIQSSLPIKDERNLKFTVEAWKSLEESTVQLQTDVQFQHAVKGLEVITASSVVISSPTTEDSFKK